MREMDKLYIDNSSVIRLDRHDKVMRIRLDGNPALYNMCLDRHNGIVIEVTGNNTLDLVGTNTPDYISLTTGEDGKLYIDYIYKNLTLDNFKTNTPETVSLSVDGDNLVIDFIGKIESGTPDIISVDEENGLVTVSFVGTLVRSVESGNQYITATTDADSKVTVTLQNELLWTQYIEGLVNSKLAGYVKLENTKYSENPDDYYLVKTIFYIIDPNTGRITLDMLKKDVNNGAETTVSLEVPISSALNDGIITKEQFTEIIALRDDVDQLKNASGNFIGVSFTTKADLDAYTVPDTVRDTDFTYVINDETQGGATSKYSWDADSRAWQFVYTIDFEPIGIATNESAGIVKAQNGGADGTVAVEALTGDMTVNGWSTINNSIDSVLSYSEAFVYPQSGYISAMFQNDGTEIYFPGGVLEIRTIDSTESYTVPATTITYATGSKIIFNPSTLAISAAAVVPSGSLIIGALYNEGDVQFASINGLGFIRYPESSTPIQDVYGRSFYGTSDTVPAVSLKDVLINDQPVEFIEGDILHVLFSYRSNTSDVSLRIGGNTYIVSPGAEFLGMWNANALVRFVFDGEIFMVSENLPNTFYLTSPSLAATPQKVATSTITPENNVQFNKAHLISGNIVSIVFQYANTADAITLNIDGTGAYPIYVDNTTQAGSGAWSAGELKVLCFTGDKWIIVNKTENSEQTYIQPSCFYGTSTTSGAEKVVVSSYDRAPVTGDTLIVKFTYANNGSYTQLVIDGTRYTVIANGSDLASNTWDDGETVVFHRADSGFIQEVKNRIPITRYGTSDSRTSDTNKYVQFSSLNFIPRTAPVVGDVVYVNFEYGNDNSGANLTAWGNSFPIFFNGDQGSPSFQTKETKCFVFNGYGWETID